MVYFVCTLKSTVFPLFFIMSYCFVVLNSTLLPGQFRGVKVTFCGMNISEACSIKHSEKASTPDRHASDDRVYDLQGRRMDVRHLPKGIYIQHGKKFVVK